MHAIILAGGFGTRLKSAIADVPKPMAPIGAKPFLSYLIDYLKTQGFTQVTLSVHHLREQIQDYFKASYNGVAITYAVEEKPLGTGGAIVNSLKQIETSEPVFVLNGDTFLKLDYRLMWQQHLLNSPRMTMALRKISDCSRYGVVKVENHRVLSFEDLGGNFSGLINGGVYVLAPALFEMIELPEVFSFERDFLYPHAREISPLAFVTEDYFIDIGIPEDYRRAAVDLMAF